MRLYWACLLELLLPRRRELRRLRAKWGRPGAKEITGVRRYFDLTRDPAVPTVDDKTWSDLELPKVFANLDSTESPLGSQYLYRQLRTYVDSQQELADYHANCQRLRADTMTREKIQLRLSALQDAANGPLVDTIFGAMPARTWAMRLLPWWSAVCLTTLLVVIAMKLPIWIWLATIAANLLLIFHFTLPMQHEVAGLRGCHRMLRIADALAAQPISAQEPKELVTLRVQGKQRAKALAELHWLSALHGSLTGYLAVWINLAFLAELVAYVRTIGRLDRIRAELASTFSLLGSLDASIAVASYLEGNPDHCAPLLIAESRVKFTDARHPLIATPVANSLCLDQRSALVTGSNMAGKTTFIKMIGVNVILGRTLGFCLAKSAVVPVTTVMAAIKSEHSVESGKSRYFAELEAIRGLIDAAWRGESGLLLVDELLSGTNTVERLAASRAILESLAGKALVLATTHDVELQQDLASHYDLYYFQEDPDLKDGFDYRLHHGRSSRRNAIRLLQREGFPADIVADALAYSEHYATQSEKTAR